MEILVKKYTKMDMDGTSNGRYIDESRKNIDDMLAKYRKVTLLLTLLLRKWGEGLEIRNSEFEIDCKIYKRS